MAQDFYQRRGIHSPPFSAEFFAGGPTSYASPTPEEGQNALTGAIPEVVIEYPSTTPAV
jgi:hypothetical protein